MAELGIKLCFPKFASLPVSHGPCSGAVFSMLLPISVMCWQLLTMVPICPAAIPAYIPHVWLRLGLHTGGFPSSTGEARFRSSPGPWLVWLGLSIETLCTLWIAK